MVIPDHLSCEVIVVDNNSDDDTRLVFEEIEKSFESKIRYVFENKTGLSHARNRGIREASGKEAEFLQRLQSAGEKILYYPLSIIYHNIPAHRW